MSDELITIFSDAREVIVDCDDGCQVRMMHAYHELIISYNFFLCAGHYDSSIADAADMRVSRHDTTDYSYEGIRYLLKNHFHVFERKNFDYMKYLQDLRITDLSIILPFLRFFSGENFDSDFKSIVAFVENYC
jgi:hypothetical protein